MLIDYDIECRSCEGTGLYVGMAERDGAAVVCQICNGTGCEKLRLEVQQFVGRHERTGVARVFQVNPGYVIEGSGEITPGGVPYSEWLKDPGSAAKPGKELRLACPAWWYQSADYRKKPGWKECIGIGMFSSCKHYGERDKCWERFDREHPTKAS